MKTMTKDATAFDWEQADDQERNEWIAEHVCGFVWVVTHGPQL